MFWGYSFVEKRMGWLCLWLGKYITNLKHYPFLGQRQGKDTTHFVNLCIN